MKITRNQLRKLIKEEMRRLINEQDYDESDLYTLEDGLELVSRLRVVNPRLAKSYDRNLRFLNDEKDKPRLSMIVRQLLYDLEADTIIDDVDEFQPGFSEDTATFGAELGGGMTSQDYYSTLRQQWKEETGDGELSPDEAARLRALTADAISDSLSDSAGDRSIDIEMTEIEESGFGQWGRDLAKKLGYSDVKDMDPYIDSDDYGNPFDAWVEGVSAVEYAKSIS